jgi:predicted nucleotidyltransferase/DNA-binding XRE family transcriptional regulator
MSGQADFSYRLRVRRKAAGLTQRDLAKSSGVKQPTIAAIESGTRAASPATREALENALRGIRPAALLFDHIDEVDAVLVNAGATNPRVFGSVARGNDRPESDIDLLVHLPPNASIMDLLRVEEELARILTVNVDLVSDTSDAAGPVLQRALAEAVPL